MDIKKFIKTNDNINKQLMAEFGVSDKTVYNARYFATDSYTTRQIRRRALELGGVLMQEVAATAEGSPTDQGEAVDPTKDA